MIVKKYLRNSGGLRCWLGLFSVQLCNYAVKSGYQGFIQGEGRGALGYPPKAHISPLIFKIINFIQCQIQGFEIALVNQNLSAKT